MTEGRAIRVGVVLPSVNAVLERDLWRHSPPRLTYQSTRVPLAETTPEGIRTMNEALPAAAELLAAAGPDLCLYGCTSGSFIDGLEGLERIVSLLTAIVGCPVVATTAAVVDALEALGIRRVALATPYVDEVNDLEASFLESTGFRVTAVRGLGLSGSAIREVEPSAVAALAFAADTPDADAVPICGRSTCSRRRRGHSASP
jgi:maleate cis-trans isomerase